MKLIRLLILISFCYTYASAQLVPCRPKTAMVDYNFHNDSFANSDRTRIMAVRPDILIDNTRHGFWGEVNGYRGCIPSYYTSLGIEVYSYIVGGHEGTWYGDDTDGLAQNLARIDSIAADSATGVFLDEVTSVPGTAAQAYIAAIYNECLAKNLKLIVNPGTSTFSTWLLGNCTYIVTDEHYDGTRAPTSAEYLASSRTIVLSLGATNATDATNIATGARANCFEYSYACDTYTSLPSWMETYLANATGPLTAPVITLTSGVLSSNYQCGNSWGKIGVGHIPSALGSTFTPSSSGCYYNIVTRQGCASDTSNIICVAAAGIDNSTHQTNQTLMINAQSNQVEISNSGAGEIVAVLIDMSGHVVYKQQFNTSVIFHLDNLPNGLYVLSVTSSQEHLITKIPVSD